MSHSKEPWAVDSERELRIEDQHGRSIASCGCSDLLRDEWEPNARRIVACVNACAGISNEMLDDDCFNKMRDDRDALLSDIKAVEALSESRLEQRDALLAAARDVMSLQDRMREGQRITAVEFIPVYQAIVDAIAKAEAGQ